MFYLKYRPQTIDEIDSEMVKERLKIMLSAKRIPHAFLFAGPKGTGKTSSARIVAKSINCQNNLFSNKKQAENQSIEPCNKCQQCISITSGNSIDIIEMDAASNRKIDEIRDLIGRVKFSPILNRYKVYIIDEVHMLTNESFNALLKTLEEPPLSAVFILATTEPDKLPKTIISRCIKFNFHKAKNSEIIRMLKRISQKEKIAVSDDILQFIANYCDHSFRDAAKLLEEAVALYDNKKQKILIDDVKKILGLADESNDLLKSLEKKDQKKSLEFIEQYEDKGGDCKILIEFILNKLHALLLKKNNLPSGLEENYTFTLGEITLLIKLFQEAYNVLKYSPIEVLPLEIAVVQYINS